MDEMIFDVVADGPKKDAQSFGARRSRGDAEAHLDRQVELYKRSAWRNFRIEEVDTTGLFQLPSRPTPRERYSIDTIVTEKSPHGHPRRVHVDIHDGDRIVGSYDRDYAMLRTFEPFRQGERDYALISPQYTTTAVMDLQTGEIVAAEEPHSSGFCPVGFYVPDWWDVHARLEESGTLPGSGRWKPEYEWASGSFGFLWGCIWADDWSWKVQHLDLSRVCDGTLQREERFGYLVLDTGEAEGREIWRDAREFIRVSNYGGVWKVDFRTRQSFDLTTGALQDPLD